MAKTILVVDDYSDDRELIGEALHEIDESIGCSYATQAFEALDMLCKPGNVLPDFIILDLNMHRLSGNQCLALIKKSERLQSIPVIIFTTSKLDRDVDEARELGALLFLTKPSRFSE
jgi:CheY-like chemotaxis protein